MGKTSKDKRIDDYIAKAKPFARPILRYLRSVVHTVCPSVEETVKWGFPHFNYNGKILCSMASFNEHAVFGFWKASLMRDPALMENAKKETAMGHLGRICSLKDLPAKTKLRSYIKEAMALNDSGARVARKRTAVKVPAMPREMMAALNRDSTAKNHFSSLSPSHKKEYIVWIQEAKRAVTRERRIEQMLVWLKEGKSRSWKYGRA